MFRIYILFFNYNVEKYGGENVGSTSYGLAESNFRQYQDSPGHYSWMINPKVKLVGIGITGRYHCEKYYGGFKSTANTLRSAAAPITDVDALNPDEQTSRVFTARQQ